MRKRFYRTMIAVSMTMILFAVSACGNHASDSETLQIETESEGETETESPEEVEAEAETKVEDGEYRIYPSFVTTFELEDNILTIRTEDVFEDFPVPEEMAIHFAYPLAEDFEWSDSTSAGSEDDVDWYEWFSFYWEGITMSVDRYLDGQYGDHYTNGEDFCKKNAVWTIVIKEEKVVSIRMDLDNADTEKSETAQESKASAEITNNAKADGAKETNVPASSNPTTSVPASKPVHEHTWAERYDTITHEAQGEWQQVQVGSGDEVIVCNYCGTEFADDYAFLDHCASYVPTDHGRASYTYRAGSPIYEEQWVETSPAWTETIVIGYECPTCGATK